MSELTFIISLQVSRNRILNSKVVGSQDIFGLTLTVQKLFEEILDHDCSISLQSASRLPPFKKAQSQDELSRVWCKVIGSWMNPGWFTLSPLSHNTFAGILSNFDGPWSVVIWNDGVSDSIWLYWAILCPARESNSLHCWLKCYKILTVRPVLQWQQVEQ